MADDDKTIIQMGTAAVGKYYDKFTDKAVKGISTVNDRVSMQELIVSNKCMRTKLLNAWTTESFSKTVIDAQQKASATGRAQTFITGGLNTTPQLLRKDYTINSPKVKVAADSDAQVRIAFANMMSAHGAEWIRTRIIDTCKQQVPAPNIKTRPPDIKISDVGASYPFDRRLDRLRFESANEPGQGIVPHASSYAQLSTAGYLLTPKSLDAAITAKTATAKQKKTQAEKWNQMAKNGEFYHGVPALQNYYALIRLYGSNGGKFLTNQKGQRRWYEVDSTPDTPYNFASTPTTSALISWGKGDPYGRTPYQFSDFVFAKYWKKIENNRLITLRRYAAPILDNMKFPGMISESLASGDISGVDSTTTGKEDEGSVIPKNIVFPPMATAVTYFGGETGNTLSSILKFTTGVPWEDVKAEVWTPTTENVPDNKAGAGSLYGGIAKFGEMLNVAGGNFDLNMVQADGALPPDPYNDGPYENRILGPVNRIDSVKKRKAGLNYENAGLELVFEYVARPVGGINPKAVLLDILGNFLVIGSASAVFFGGAHRFMAAPAKYPFMGGGKGIEQMYRGDPMGWAATSIKQFTQGGDKGDMGTNTGATDSAGAILPAASGFMASVKAMFEQLLSGGGGGVLGSLGTMLSGSFGNITKNEIAKKTAGQIPYLHGMKAILTGEPIGEWHVAVGNPLNPIAMIGNLVCESLTVEFNDELGPDDFPTEVKITVKLAHAMARDRDAIESMFNRGMGRIYQLPDTMTGSADYQTIVDPATKREKVGLGKGGRDFQLYHPGMDSRYISPAQLKGTKNQLGGELSVWNRASFSSAISENSSFDQTSVNIDNNLFISAFRSANWIAQKGLL